MTACRSSCQVYSYGHQPPESVFNVTTPTANPLSPIGKRLLITLLFIGSVVTLIATAAVLFMDYRAGLRQFDSALEQIRSSHQQSITYSLWNFDKRQLENQLLGILNFPGVIHVQLDHDGNILHSVGDLYRKPDRRMNITLTYDSAGTRHTLGVLRISQDYRSLYDDLLGRAVEIFLTQLLQVFSLALILLLVVNRLITRRLSHMSDWASSFNLGNHEPELRVDRPGDNPDELSQVADAINRMRASLLADIHMRETEHQQLAQLKEQLSLAIDNAALGFCRYDLKNDTFHGNSHFAGQLGLNEPELETLNQPMEFLLSRITGSNADNQIARIRQLLLGHQVRLHDSFRLLDKQQQQRFVDISLQVIDYHDNRPEHVLICMTDRSQELRAREQLNILRLQMDQEIKLNMQELHERNAALEQERNQLQRDLQRLNTSRHTDQISLICGLLANDMQHWQPYLRDSGLELWQRFIGLDMHQHRSSIDICQCLRNWLQRQEQQLDFVLELHLPLSLIVDENPQIPEFFLHTLIQPHGIWSGPENSMTLSLRIHDAQLETELRLTGNGWPQHPDTREFRLCQALAGLRYNGKLNWRKEEQQQVLLLSIPFVQ